jgi:hypothetical protein
MTFDFMSYITTPLQNFYLVILALKAMMNLIFATAVARDAGFFEKRGLRTSLVSGLAWAFSTLVGGVLVAAVYWFIHHSTLTRADYQE